MTRGVQVDIVLEHPLAEIPFYATDGSSGFDLKACIDYPLILRKGEWRLIPTGIRVAIPYGFEMQIRPRSGLALNRGLTIKNTPGTIDSDYRGPVGVILSNEGDDDVIINPGDKIAQGVICPVYKAVFNRIERLDDTKRGEGGFGSTGV